MSTVVSIYVQGHTPIMWNLCAPVFVLTMLIAVSSKVVYILTVVLYLHMNLLVYVAFEEHIYCWNICGKSMANKSCKLLFCFTYMYSNVGTICWLSSSAGEHIHTVWHAYFVQGHMLIMYKICILELLFILLIAMGSQCYGCNKCTVSLALINMCTHSCIIK